MPNHVTHRIIFDTKHAEKIFKEVCPNNAFDFELLIPLPLQVYRSNSSSEDQKDFGEFNWYEWCINNWELNGILMLIVQVL